MLKIRQILFPIDKKNLRYYSDVIPADIIEKVIAGDSIITVEALYTRHKQIQPTYISKIRSPDIPELYDTIVWELKRSNRFNIDDIFLNKLKKEVDKDDRTKFSSAK